MYLSKAFDTLNHKLWIVKLVTYGLGHSKNTFFHGVEWGEGGWGSLKAKENKKGEGVKPICMFALWKKIAWFFKQQTKFFLISCLAVAKSFSVLSPV